MPPTRGNANVSPHRPVWFVSAYAIRSTVLQANPSRPAFPLPANSNFDQNYRHIYLFESYILRIFVLYYKGLDNTPNP